LVAPPVRPPRPTNYWRNAFHVGSGVGALLAFEHVLTPGSARALAGAAFTLGWSLEISRVFSPAVNRFCMWIFQKVAHPHEAIRVNSATWFTSAVLAIAWFAPDLHGGLGLLVLAVGDPAAAVVGKRWGRRRFSNGKSLAGSLGFAGAAGIASAAYLALWHPELGAAATLALAAVAATSGALVELWSGRVDDNLTIPVGVAAATLGVHALL
jgi:dolichol kinase